MFKAGDFVIRKNNCNVCEIVGVEQCQLGPGFAKEEYFVLKSVFDSTERRVPVNKADSLLSYAMKKGEAEDFIKAIAQKEYAWNNNDDKPNVSDSKKVLENDSSVETLSEIVGTYYSRLAKGKTISRGGKNFLDSVEDVLFPTLGFSLEKTIDEVRSLMRGAFGIEDESESAN